MWFQQARYAIYDAEDFRDKLLTNAFGSSKVRTNITNTIETNKYSTKRKIKNKMENTGRAIHPYKETIEEELLKITNALKDIAAQKDNLGLKNKSELTSYREGRVSSCLASEISTFDNRSMDKDLIIGRLSSREGSDDALRVIPIVGMGGIGKTTLASMVFNESKNLPDFKLKGWVHVSDEFDATRVIKSLLEFMTGQKSAVDNNFALLQRELRDKLQGNRFLIVLDDFWSSGLEDWDVLKECFSAGDVGSRVIVTTRIWEVARTVTTSRGLSHELEKLSRDESWKYFEANAEKDSMNNSTLRDIGMQVVSRCDGLPFAIKIIGRLLRSKGDDVSEWRRILKNEIWRNEKVIPSLRLSYYHLPEGVKNCFAYCSIFRKHYTFSIEEMIMLWVGEGLMDKFCNGNPPEDEARTYFAHLHSACFFQESSDGGSEFVMHSLIHDLASSVASGLCLDLHNVNVQSRRLSYIQGKDEHLLKNTSVTKLHHLRTFLPLRENYFVFQGRFYFESKLFGELLSNFKLLRVLTLKGYRISKLPKSVGGMKLLRYLDLSNTYIVHLPHNLCGLYNLRILLLSDCWNLRRLPSKICNLVNMRHLYIDGTNLEEMPDGIGKMTNIQTLSNYVLGRGKSKQMREFKELLNLQGKLHISGLNNVKDANDVVIAGFKQKEILEELVLEWEATSEQDEQVLDAIEAHKNLKSLTIKGYGGKRLSDWILGASPSFTDLTSLGLTGCYYLGSLPSLGNLPFLKNLKVEGLNSLESFGEEFYGDSHTPFQALEELHIDGMDALKTWCFPGGGRVVFKMLKDLQIQSCRQLTKIPYCFPSLTRLLIESCDNLIKLEMRGEAEEGSSSITAYRHPFQSVRIIRCPMLEEIPNSFTNSDSFEIELCEKLVTIPRLQHVRKLTLKDCYGVPLPVQACRDEVMEELTIKTSLSDIHRAKIHRFTSLKSMELIIPRICSEDGELMTQLPPNLSDFTIRCNTSLHVNTEILTELRNHNCLTKLGFYECGALESFPDAELPSTLKSLTLAHCSPIISIPDRFLSGCSKSLKELWIDNCPNLACLAPSLLTLESLQRLDIQKCCSIRQLPSTTTSGPNYLKNLSYLRISDCRALECLPVGFHKATTLHTLHIEHCPSLCVTKDGIPTTLIHLHITQCGKMKPFIQKVLPTLTSLTLLHLQGFPDIISLDHCLPDSIQSLTVREFPNLKSISGLLPNLKHLTRLEVDDRHLVDKTKWSKKLNPLSWLSILQA
uniref:NB-ARC domain-containing protein n=1 Tax=Kalanchoe fedtschenkoi TaxID=63787 RepID=A0A7N0VFE3_KALFE